jgi:hypothetical protein
MTSPTVDVIIPVHSRTRPIRRAVSSVVLHTAAAARVTVVAHNLSPEIVSTNLGDLAHHEQVRIIEQNDSIRSPASPMNRGLDEATGRFTTIMGSDDEFEAGAIDSWLRVQGESDAAMVITRTVHEGRGFDAFPPVRPRRLGSLDPVKDRLSYQSAPLGLIDRHRLGHLRFPTDLLSGEDIPYSLQIFFSGLPLAIDVAGPGYRVHHDATDRVSFTPRPVEQDFAFLDHVLNESWFRALSRQQKQAVVVKVLRTQFFDAIGLRVHALDDVDGAQQPLRTVLDRLRSSAPSAEKLLSRVDQDVLTAVFENGESGADVLSLLQKRWNYRSIPAILPRNPFLGLHRQAPFRTLYAGFMMMQPRPDTAN